MTEKTFKVFICSTYSDLINERTSILEVTRQLQLLHASMEFFGARPETPLETVLEEVRASDIVVIIIGYRYGTLVPGRRVSYTEAEYKEAWKNKKPCLVYIRAEDLPILPSHIEREPSKIKSLEKFKTLLRSRHLIANYSKTDDLALSFAIDIERTIKTIKHEPKIESMDSTLSLLDFLNTPSLLCNIQNQILGINQTLTKVLGYSSSEMIGKPIASFILKKHNMSPSEYNFPYLADTGVRYVDLVFRKKNRDPIYFELDIHKYELRGKAIIQCVARDITERKKYEEALRLTEANSREKLEKLVEIIGIRTPKDKSRIDEVMSKAELAYTAYMDAERQVAKAYHENEIQIGLAYKRAESAAMKNFNSTLLQAKTILDEVLKKPPESESYQNAISNFHDSIIQALATYNDNLDKAWIACSETTQMAWDIYSKIER